MLCGVFEDATRCFRYQDREATVEEEDGSQERPRRSGDHPFGGGSVEQRCLISNDGKHTAIQRARMERSWHVFGPEPAPLRPGTEPCTANRLHTKVGCLRSPMRMSTPLCARRFTIHAAKALTKNSLLLAEGSQHVIWRKSSDAAVSAKILGIERQQIRNSVHAHRCHHASVMDLDT
jgi:hypothetical protein